MTALLEIRTYKLVPGGRDEFDRIVREGSVPMLERFGIRVVAFGLSADADDHYVLIRAFASAAERDEQLGSFYASDEWRASYRDAALSLIEAYHTVALPLTPDRRAALTAAASLEGDPRSTSPR